MPALRNLRTMTKRTAIYARFSSDLQRDRSIDDQIALCRAYADRNNMEIVALFEDRARSGASLLGRDGLMAMMERSRDPSHPFDVIIVEALDRPTRDQEDLAGLYKRLSLAGVDIMAVHEGRADQMQVGNRGLVGALYLQDLAQKVRRGMSGVIAMAGMRADGLTVTALSRAGLASSFLMRRKRPS
jgi:DNA invertase Pin-like site-specific DNA recombinase